MTKLFDFLNDVTNHKKGLLRDENKKEYVPFVINRMLSNSIDTVIIAHEMNLLHGISKQMHHDFLMSSIRRGRRFLKFKKIEKNERHTLLKKYFGYSTKKLNDALKILPEPLVDEYLLYRQENNIRD
jgi:hypothetical protein